MKTGLIGHEVFNDIGQAIAIEIQIKKWSSTKKGALANGDEEMIRILAECRNASHYKFRPEGGLDCARLDR
ncbi:hypothetical protein [Maribacter polysiphoniae]|uniref:hypothetical protein n=1 Tax=Maribacter polysiphoniae TaxID=429344 RepID=UPI0030811242